MGIRKTLGMTGPVPLPDDESAAAVARRIVRDALRTGDGDAEVDADVVDTAIQIVSELASNAVSHGEPPYVLDVQLTAAAIQLTVSNHGDGDDPLVKAATTDAGRGRGLAMVAELADDWGWHRDGGVLTVWAVVSRVT